MTATKQRCKIKNSLREVLVVAALAALAAFILNATTPDSPRESGSAATPTGSVSRTQTLDACWLTESVWRQRAVTGVWRGRAYEPTAALRAAVLVATAVTVIAASSVVVASAPDQVQRYRRPAWTGSRRWAAGWAGQAEHAGGRPVAARSFEKVTGG
jgi:hypothetical protein